MRRAGFTFVSLDKYVDLHMKANPHDRSRRQVVSALRAALDDRKRGVKCQCGNPIWVIGSAFAGNACFTCITGEAYPDGDYEIDGA